MEDLYDDKPYEDLLHAARLKYCRSFKTDFACVCGEGVITDHASLGNPDLADANAHALLTGMGATAREQLRSFQAKLWHRYWCDTCGVWYRREVIEVAKGYKPLEAREPVRIEPDLPKQQSADLLARGATRDFA